MWLVCPASPLAICVLSFRVWCCAGAPSSKIGEGTATLPQGRSTRQIDLAKPTLAFPTLAKSNFGQTDFGQKNLTDFGQTDFGQFSFLVFYPSGLHPSEGWGPEWVGLERVGPERVGLERVGPRRVEARRVGARRVGGPKFPTFLPSPATILLFLCLSGDLLVESGGGLLHGIRVRLGQRGGRGRQLGHGCRRVAVEGMQLPVDGFPSSATGSRQGAPCVDAPDNRMRAGSVQRTAS